MTDEVLPPPPRGASATGYRQLLSVPDAPTVLAFGLLGRTPLSMLPVTLVIAGEAVSGSYAVGGAASASFSLAAAAVSPLAGHWVDRWGQRRVGRRLVSVFVLVCVLLVVTVAWGAAGWTVIPLAAVAGASAPNLGAYARARWNGMVPSGQLPAAHALESVNDEVNFLVGPASATALAVVIGPVVPLALVATASLTGVVGLTRLPDPVLPAAGATRPGNGRWLDRRRIWLVGAMVGLGVALSATLVMIVAFTAELGRDAGAALVLGMSSTASLGSALLYGRLAVRRPPQRRFTLATLAYAILLWPLALAPGFGSLAAAAFVAGAAIAPIFIQANALVALTTARHQVTQAFSWVGAGVALGLAIGSTVAGAIIDGVGADAARGSIVLLGLGPLLFALGGELRERLASSRPDPS